VTKKKQKVRMGRPPKHGGYSIIYKDRAIKDHPEIRRYLEGCRAGLVRDLAGDEDKLSEQQRIMIDRIVSRLAVCRLIEVYVEKCGLFRRDRLEGERVLELEPALGQNYLAFSNSIDRALAALGLNKKQGDDVLDLGKYIAEADAREAKAKEAQGRAESKGHGKGKAVVQAQADVADQADGQGKDQGPGVIARPRPTSGDVSEPEGGEGKAMGEGGEDGGDNGNDPSGSPQAI